MTWLMLSAIACDSFYRSEKRVEMVEQETHVKLTKIMQND